MKIDHIAIWALDLEKMRLFYTKYFGMKCSNRYENVQTGFTSYFLSFEGGARVEIMSRRDITISPDTISSKAGLSHFAISVGSMEAVNRLTEQLKTDGFKILSEPRTTGDGYYESLILDPEGNHVEITV